MYETQTPFLGLGSPLPTITTVKTTGLTSIKIKLLFALFLF